MLDFAETFRRFIFEINHTQENKYKMLNPEGEKNQEFEMRARNGLFSQKKSDEAR